MSTILPFRGLIYCNILSFSHALSKAFYTQAFDLTMFSLPHTADILATASFLPPLTH